MTGAGVLALARLALLRMRARPGWVAIVVLAVGAAATLVGWSGIAGALSQQENVRARLRELPPDQRSLQVVYYVRIGEVDARRAAVDAAFTSFGGVTGPARRVSMLQSVGPRQIRPVSAADVTPSGIRLVSAADPKRDVEVVRGRLPTGCSRRVCEALALAGDFRIGQDVELGRNVSARIVGRGAVRHEALPVGSDALPKTPDLLRQALLVSDFDPPLTVFAQKETGTTVVTTAALEPEAVQATELRALRERIRVAFVRLERTGPLIDETGPLGLLDDLVRRGDVAQERLLLVAAQGAALLVAFAAFVAAARRRDTRLLAEQLTTFGASRAQAAFVRAFEAAAPAAAGGLVAVASLEVAARVLADRRGLTGEFASAALSTPTLVTIALLTVAAAVLLFASAEPRRGSPFGVGALEVAAVAAFALIVWQAAARGGLSAATIAAGHRDPILLLLPALAFFTSGVALLRGVPPLLRLAERLARRAAFALRLAFLTAARSPAEAAAATTFLAVALGVAAFALNYRATLASQSVDEARFAAGAAWRVIERPPERGAGETRQTDVAAGDRVTPTVLSMPPLGESDVTPLTRFASASAERPTPVLHLAAQLEEASATGGSLEVELLGLPAPRLPELGGWRDGFSSLDRRRIASQLRPRPVKLSGPRVGLGVRELRFWARSDSQLERFVVAHFLLPDEQRFGWVRGAMLTPDWAPLTIRIPRALRHAELVALEFPAVDVPQSAPPDEGSLQLGRFEEHRAGRWQPLPTPKGWATGEFGGSVDRHEYVAGPVRQVTTLDIDGSPLALIHYDAGIPQVPSALVSRSVAAAAVDGRITLTIGGTMLPVRVSGTARYFPTITTHPRDFAVLDYDTLFAVLNAGRPGAALPSEAWFFAPQRARFVDRLAERPFRVERLVGAQPVAERLASDPLAAGARQVLVLAAAAAAALALLGLALASAATLDAERPAFAEYEALGVAPATLRRSLQTRLAALAAVGVAAGVVGGALATRLIGALVAVTADAAQPLPPIEAVVAWKVDAVLIAATAAAALGAAALIARRALRETAARRLRA